MNSKPAGYIVWHPVHGALSHTFSTYNQESSWELLAKKKSEYSYLTFDELVAVFKKERYVIKELFFCCEDSDKALLETTEASYQHLFRRYERLKHLFEKLARTIKTSNNLLDSVVGEIERTLEDGKE